MRWRGIGRGEAKGFVDDFDEDIHVDITRQIEKQGKEIDREDNYAKLERRIWDLQFATAGGIPLQDGALYNPARGGVQRLIWKGRMADENGAVVDGDWERDFVFNWDWAWDANRAIAEDDCGQRDESAAGRDLESLLAGVFR